jgi:hypothetical protein
MAAFCMPYFIYWIRFIKQAKYTTRYSVKSSTICIRTAFLVHHESLFVFQVMSKNIIDNRLYTSRYVIGLEFGTLATGAYELYNNKSQLYKCIKMIKRSEIWNSSKSRKQRVYK